MVSGAAIELVVAGRIFVLFVSLHELTPAQWPLVLLISQNTHSLYCLASMIVIYVVTSAPRL